MGSRNSGRRPRPNHLRALEGVRESRLTRDEPIPTEAAIVPPVELVPAAQAVWDRLAPDLIATRVLTAWDVDSFAVYCRSVALFNRAVAEVEAEGASTERKYKGLVPSPAFRAMIALQKTVTALGSKFGLSPADRATLKIDNGPKTGASRLIDGYIR
jgi:P27 family predicted phage terminase small subunit